MIYSSWTARSWEYTRNICSKCSACVNIEWNWALNNHIHQTIYVCSLLICSSRFSRSGSIWLLASCWISIRAWSIRIWVVSKKPFDWYCIFPSILSTSTIASLINRWMRTVDKLLLWHSLGWSVCFDGNNTFKNWSGRKGPTRSTNSLIFYRSHHPRLCSPIKWDWWGLSYFNFCSRTRVRIRLLRYASLQSIHFFLCPVCKLIDSKVSCVIRVGIEWINVCFVISKHCFSERYFLCRHIRNLMFIHKIPEFIIVIS